MLTWERGLPVTRYARVYDRLFGAIAPLAIVLFGFALRVLWFFLGPASDTPDTLAYITTGDALFATGQMSSAIYMPLYPTLIHVAGYNGIILLQILLSSVTIALTYVLALRLWGNRQAALLAALLCAAHPILIYMANVRLSETTFIFLLMLGLVALYERLFLVGSIALVVAGLCRPTLDLILPLIVAAAAVACGEGPRGVAKRIGVLALVYVALMAPWWVHNYRMYGEFVRLDLASGITALLENNRSFEAHRFDWSTDPPWAQFASIEGSVARDRAMLHSAIEYVIDNPRTWLWASGDRLVRLFTPWPSPQISASGKLACALFLLPIFVLAGISLAANRRRLRELAPLALPVLWIVALHGATHANMRYRLPIDAILIVLAAGALFAARPETTAQQ